MNSGRPRAKVKAELGQHRNRRRRNQLNGVLTKQPILNRPLGTSPTAILLQVTPHILAALAALSTSYSPSQHDDWCIQAITSQLRWSTMVRYNPLTSLDICSLIASRKTPWRLSAPRKARARSRLKGVDEVIETVRQSGVQCEALVRPTIPPLLANQSNRHFILD